LHSFVRHPIGQFPAKVSKLSHSATYSSLRKYLRPTEYILSLSFVNIYFKFSPCAYHDSIYQINHQHLPDLPYHTISPNSSTSTALEITMAPNPRIYDVLLEILDLIFKDLSHGELLSLPVNLLTRGLRALTAEARFQHLHFYINTDSLARLWRLSKYPGTADIVKTSVNTVRMQKRGLDDFLKLQWERHLKDYHRKCPMPKCVTMDDVHKAVGVKNWRFCRTCAGLPPRQQLNHFIRSESE